MKKHRVSRFDKGAFPVQYSVRVHYTGGTGPQKVLVGPGLTWLSLRCATVHSTCEGLFSRSSAQVHEYCSKGIFASDFDDLIGNALCQIFQVKCDIGQLNATGIDWRTILPLRQASTGKNLRTIPMVRYNNHYDGLEAARGSPDCIVISSDNDDDSDNGTPQRSEENKAAR